MVDKWNVVPATKVQLGDRIRAAGEELTVARVEWPFLGGTEYIAFIEDSPVRWYKQPIPADSDVEVLDRS